MFANQRGTAGLGGLVAVAVLIALWLGSAGVMLKAYREGGAAPEPTGCELVCRSATTSVKG